MKPAALGIESLRNICIVQPYVFMDVAGSRDKDRSMDMVSKDNHRGMAMVSRDNDRDVDMIIKSVGFV